MSIYTTLECGHSVQAGCDCSLCAFDEDTPIRPVRPVKGFPLHRADDCEAKIAALTIERDDARALIKDLDRTHAEVKAIELSRLKLEAQGEIYRKALKAITERYPESTSAMVMRAIAREALSEKGKV